MDEPRTRIERARDRDAARARLRRLTVGAVAGATALGGLFAGVAAKAVPGRKTTTVTRTTASAVRTTTAAIPAAPAPIVPAGSSEPPASSATPAAPAQAPTQAAAPPVVVSGGS